MSAATAHAAEHVSSSSPPPSSGSDPIVSETEDEELRAPVTDDRVVMSNAEGLDFELVDPSDDRKIMHIDIWKTQSPNVVKLTRVCSASREFQRRGTPNSVYVSCTFLQ